MRIVAVIGMIGAVASPLPAQLLEALPLFGRENFLESLVSLPPNLFESRVRLFTQRAQLLARVAEDLLHLCPLIRAQLQLVEHLLELIAPVCACVVPQPTGIDSRRERARRRAEQEDDERGDAIFVILSISRHLTSSRRLRPRRKPSPAPVRL
jgi:hypothetical protein